MKNSLVYEANLDYPFTRSLVPADRSLDRDSLEVSERIDEIMMMCDREQPVYERISSFSVALYALGFFDCPDLMSFEDVDAHQAAAILKDNFTEIRPEVLPEDYRVTESKERFLLVVGDPLFPIHFAAVVDMRSSQPFFSKLPFLGSGFDSLEELVEEFAGKDGITAQDFHFFKKIWYGRIPPESVGRIYIVKD